MESFMYFNEIIGDFKDFSGSTKIVKNNPYQLL